MRTFNVSHHFISTWCWKNAWNARNRFILTINIHIVSLSFLCPSCECSQPCRTEYIPFYEINNILYISHFVSRTLSWTYSIYFIWTDIYCTSRFTFTWKTGKNITHYKYVTFHEIVVKYLVYALLKVHKHEIFFNFFLPKSNSYMPLVNFRKKFRLVSVDFRQNFEVRTFPRWLSIRGTKFFLRDIQKNFLSKSLLWSY